MQTEKPQPEANRKMPETRYIEFPELSVEPRVGISRCASETDFVLYFLHMTLKIVIYHPSFVSIIDIFRRIKKPFPNVIRCFSWRFKSDVASKIWSSNVML